MIKSLLSLLILSISVGLFSAPAQNSVASNGFAVINETSNEIIVEFKLPEYKIKTISVKGTKYNVIETATEASSNEVGLPMLPKFGTSVAVPYSGMVKVEVISSDYEEFSTGYFFPAQTEGFITDPANFIDLDYQEFFPVNEVASAETFIVRDLRVKPIAVNPFKYNEESKTLRVYNSIKVKFSTDSNVTGINEMPEPTSFSSSFFNLYESSVLNFDRNDVTRNVALNGNVLFIHKATTTTSFIQKLDQYVKYKKQKGYNVKVADTNEIGGTSANSIKAYIQNLYDGTDFKPDYITLVGDESGTFGVPTNNPSYANSAEGDYPYTHLAGSDLVGDVFIGRMSINNVADLSRYYGKMRSYELQATQENDDFLGRMLLVGDTAHSGESTVNNCKLVEQTASRIYSDYSYTQMYGNNPAASAMNQAINMGVGFFVYRGYIGMSGWNAGGQTNVNKLTHAVINTCSTGNFEGTATTESFMNLGSEAAPMGAITAIGMATSSTHTSFNNSLTGGIFHGIMNQHQRTMGEALLTGKLTTYIVYSASDMDDVKKFTHWCNLIGDPTVEIFVGEPLYLSAENSNIYTDSDNVSFVVRDSESHLVAGANVSLTTVSGEIFNTTTDSNGVAIITPDTIENVYQLTVNKPGYHPLQKSVSVDTESALKISSVIIDDDNEGQSSGNDNAALEAGESIEFNCILENLTTENIADVTVSLIAVNPKTSVVVGTSSIAEIVANGTAALATNFVVELGSDLVDGEDVAFSIRCEYGTETYNLIKTFNVSSSNVILEGTNLVLAGNSFDIDETATISTTIKNIAAIAVESATATLVIDNGFFNVDTEELVLSTLQLNDSETLDFTISTEIDQIPGMTAECTLVIDNGINFYYETSFIITFGYAEITDPFGPDNFGYVIYDSNDTAYDLAPVYNWIEISSSLNGAGTLLDIEDEDATGEGDGIGSNSTDTIDLPFTFNFYGEEFSQITVCSNGFISMGANSNGEFRNYRLPGALGPNGMIAAFWDDMHMNSTSGIYSYYDLDEDIFIIEWDRMINGNDSHSDEETFQVILYNPQRYATSLNQGPIKIQYKVINDVDNGNPGSYTPWHGNYSSIGIESPDGLDGLEYVYNQNYAAAAATISDGSALYITTKEVELLLPFITLNDTQIIDENGNGQVEVGEQISISTGLMNRATTVLQNVTGTLSTSNPNVTITNGEVQFNDLSKDVVNYSHSYFDLTLSEDAVIGDIISLNLSVVGDGNFRISYDIPLEVKGTQLEIMNAIINDYSATGNNNNIPEAGEDIKIAVEVRNNSQVTGTLSNLSISSTSTHMSFDISQFEDCIIDGLMTRQFIFTGSISSTAADYTEIPLEISGDYAGEELSLETQIVINLAALIIDFEDDAPLTINNPWQVGSSSSMGYHSPTNVLGTTLNSDYPDNTTGTVWTDYITVSGSTVLTFWHKYNFENNYDGGQIVIQQEGSTNSVLITPTNGYSHSNVSALGGAGYSNGPSSWQLVAVNLFEDYTGVELKVGFRFGSDSSVHREGWFIDDIEINGMSQESFLVDGTISLVGGASNVEDVQVLTENYVTYPNEDGDYSFVLPYGTFDVEHLLAGYSSSIVNIDETNSNTLQTINSEITYLEAATDLEYQLNGQFVDLTWECLTDADDIFTSYEVYQKYFTSEWEMIAEIAENSYTDTLLVNGDYEYKIMSKYGESYAMSSNTVAFIFTDGVANDDNVDAVVTNSLGSNYPNPFNPETTISFSLANASNVELKVYNVKGQLVKTLVNDHRTKGSHSVVWHGRNSNNKAVASGVYFFRMKTDSFTKTNKAILMK